MAKIHDYITWGIAGMRTFAPPVLEAYSGSKVVTWYGNIESQLVAMEKEYESQKNKAYSDKLHTFRKTWHDNPITGSLNVDTLELLAASADQLAADDWQLAGYFRGLRTSLRTLIASFEELPPPDEDAPVLRRRLKPKEGPGGPSMPLSAQPPSEAPGAAPGEPPAMAAETPAPTV